MIKLHLETKNKILLVCSHASSKINSIYEQVLLETDPNSVCFVSGNGATQISMKLPAVVAPEDIGRRVMVPASRLSAVMSALAGEVANITFKDDASIYVACGKSRLKLPYEDASVFPKMEVAASTRLNIGCEAGAFMDIGFFTQYAVAVNDVRSYLNFHHIQISDDQLYATGTNGHRLSLLNTTDQFECSGNGEFLLSPKVFSLLGALKLPTDEKLNIDVSDSHILIHTPEFAIQAVLGDGRYPNVEAVIPKHCSATAVFDKEELTDTVKRFHHIAALNKSPVIVFDFTALPKVKLRVESEGSELEEELDALTEDFPAVTIAFNSAYLQDAISHQRGDGITFKLSENASLGAGAVVVESNAQGLTTLLMPVRN
jgi:DNA polymerase-3 subunit beta